MVLHIGRVRAKDPSCKSERLLGCLSHDRQSISVEVKLEDLLVVRRHHADVYKSNWLSSSRTSRPSDAGARDSDFDSDSLSYAASHFARTLGAHGADAVEGLLTHVELAHLGVIRVGHDPTEHVL